MRLVADLHIHSKHSIATSGAMDLPQLAGWAARKGIELLGTGDFTHGEWLEAIARELRPTGGGLLAASNGVLFALTSEVALVWRYEGRCRRVHLLLLVPTLADAARVRHALTRFGSLDGNGRPMLGMDCISFLDAIWNAAPDVEVIPAHIWTPWYSLLGSRSGFDGIDDCFGPHVDRIAAVETGLSSDPPMNERVGRLDAMTLVSFSDAHSPSKIGREATVFELPEPGFAWIRNALRGERGARVCETIEVHPEHGKYHYDGHRACGVAVSPDEARALGGICPVCRKPLTLGVLHRVTDLADRPAGLPRAKRVPHRTLLPLPELVALVAKRRPQSRVVERELNRLVERYGTELRVLSEVPLEELANDRLPGLADAVRSVRTGRLHVRPGYDGVYGVASLQQESDAVSPSGENASLTARSIRERTEPSANAA